ncbi:uncharacterized protein LOC123538711 [Mercenaria mercenaria]|uniref:uncharacterized protein LOC123538711 n=1 Tax=Mercenaria mercenaria TaxID=6596 RepID=UPI001E1D77BE|nr:uncharacterized protein LOC123538711 [Mercenaria mercenaria]
MFTILFGIHFAIRTLIDWIWSDDNHNGQLPDDLDLHQTTADLHDTTDGGGTGTHDVGRVGTGYRINHLEGIGSRKRGSDDKGYRSNNDFVVPVKVAHLSAAKPINKYRKEEISRQHVTDVGSRKRELSDRNNSGNDEVDVPVKVAHLSTVMTEQESQEPFDIRKVHGYQEMPFLSDEDTINFIKHSNTMFIMRGLPGSGKSTLVKSLQNIYKGSVAVCSADDFFRSSDGSYNFDAGRLSEAHKDCQNKAAYHCNKGTPVVIIDNTNIQRWSMGFYMKLAQRSCYYHVVVLEPQTPWRYDPEELAQRNKHHVDRETIGRKLQSLRDNVYRPLYYGWFLSKEDSSMLVKKSRDVLRQCLNEVAFPDLGSQDVSDSFTALEDILSNVVISYTDPHPMLHCTAAYLARRSKDAYHNEDHVVRAMGRKFTLKISGFVYSRQALSARVVLQEDAVNLVSKESGSDSRGITSFSGTSGSENCSDRQYETIRLSDLYVKDEEEILRERYRDVHLHSSDSDQKHALFQHGCSAHITISYATEGQSKLSGENLLNILELEFYGKVKQQKSSVGVVSAYGKDLFQLQLNEPVEVNCLFQGFYSSRG